MYCKICSGCGRIHSPKDVVCKKCGSTALIGLNTDLKIEK